MNVKLIVVSGESNAREVPIKRLPLTIGRDPTADLRIVHSQISRRHCQFFLRNGRLALRDLRSSNGTFIDGKAIDEASVKPGATITIGPLTFRVEVSQSPKPAKPKGSAPKATTLFDPLADAPATGDMAATQEFAQESLFSPDDATMSFNDVVAAAGAEAAPPAEEDFFAALADGGAPVDAAPTTPAEQPATLFEAAEAVPTDPAADAVSFDAVELVDTPFAETAAPAEPLAVAGDEADFLAMLGAADTPAEEAAVPAEADVPKAAPAPEAAPEPVAETMMFEPAAEAKAESPFNFLAETEAAAEEHAAAAEATPVEELPAEAEDAAFNFLSAEAATPVETAPVAEQPAASVEDGAFNFLAAADEAPAAEATPAVEEPTPPAQPQASEDDAFNFLDAAEEAPAEAAPVAPEPAAAVEDNAFNFLTGGEAAPAAEKTPVVEAPAAAQPQASEDDAFNFLSAPAAVPVEPEPIAPEPAASAEDNAFNFLAAAPPSPAEAQPAVEPMMFEPAAEAAPLTPAPEPAAPPAEDDFFAALAGEGIETAPSPAAPAADPMAATTMFDPASAGDDLQGLMSASAEPAAEEALFDPTAASAELPVGEPSEELAESHATVDDAAFGFLSAAAETGSAEPAAPSDEVGAAPVDLDTGWSGTEAEADDEPMFAPDDLREPESVTPAADPEAFWSEMSGGTPAVSDAVDEFQPVDEYQPANEFQLADDAELAAASASIAPEHPDVGFPIEDVHGNVIDDQAQAPHGWPVDAGSPDGGGYHAFAPQTPLGAIALDDTPVLSNKITYAASDLVMTSPAAPAGKLGAPAVMLGATAAVPAAAPRRKKRRPKVADVGTGALDTLDVFFPPIMTAPVDRPVPPAPAEVMSEVLPSAGAATAIDESPAEGTDEGFGFAEALMLGARAAELESETGLMPDAADPFCETEQAIPADLPPTGSDDLTAWFDAGQGAPSVDEDFAAEPAAEAAPFDPMADEPLAEAPGGESADSDWPPAAEPPAASEDDLLDFMTSDASQEAEGFAPANDFPAEPELFAPLGNDSLADARRAGAMDELTAHEALSTEADALNSPHLHLSDAPVEEVDLTAMWGSEATIQEAPPVPPTSTEDVAFDFLGAVEEPAAEATPLNPLADEPMDSAPASTTPEAFGETAAPATPTDEDPFAAFLSEQPAASEPEFNFAAEEPAPVAEALSEAMPPAASSEPASAEDAAFDFLTGTEEPVVPEAASPLSEAPAPSAEDLPLDSLLDDLPMLEDAEEESGSVPDLASFLGDAAAEPPAAEAPAPDAETPSRSEDDELAQFLKDFGK
ncbi:MAG: FHA domain-containing protein [Planctomycetes bacterium]|nr:FHA domain-containing protein [Planctomycetota bacterium]